MFFKNYYRKILSKTFSLLGKSHCAEKNDEASYRRNNKIGVSFNKPGTAQVGAISKAQKQQKDFQESIYSTRKSKKQKQ